MSVVVGRGEKSLLCFGDPSLSYGHSRDGEYSKNKMTDKTQTKTNVLLYVFILRMCIYIWTCLDFFVLSRPVRYRNSLPPPRLSSGLNPCLCTINTVHITLVTFEGWWLFVLSRSDYWQIRIRIRVLLTTGRMRDMAQGL